MRSVVWNGLIRLTVDVLLSQVLISLETNVSGLEAIAWRFSVKKVFLEISQNSQGNTCPKASF